MNGPSNTLRLEDYTVLVVDDTLANLTLMRELLLSYGFTVLEAKDGFEAVALTRERLPDIVLLDVMMPDVDGLEVCRRLKADSRTAEIPVIFITALADSENIVSGFEAGGVDFITKPYRSPEILARIKTQLQVARLTRELRRTGEAREAEVRRRTAELEAANRSLQESRNLLQSVLDAVPDRLFVVDRQMRIIFSNVSEEVQETGVNLDGACPTCFSRLRGGAEPCRKCLVREVFVSGRCMEEEVVDEAEGRVWEIRAYPIGDEGDAVGLVVEYIRDLTSIKLVERENERRRRFLESVLVQVPDAIVTLDERHRVIDWNPGAERMFGYRPEEARGRHLDGLVARGAGLVEAAAVTGRILRGEVIEPFETVRHRQDGTPVHVIAAGSTIFDQGKLRGAVAVYSDVSAIKKSAEELHRSHELLLTVLESIDALIYVVDQDSYEVLFMNRQMQQRFALAAVGGICWRDFHGRSGPCPSCCKDRTSDGGNDDGWVWEEFDAVNGRWYRNHQRAILWVDQRLVRLHMATDISAQRRIDLERKDYERRIQQLQKMEAIGTLAGGIAHDFNNILSAVFGYTELSLLQAGGLPVLQRNLGGILEAAKRAKELVQQILLFSRQGEQKLKPLQLRPLINEALKMLRSSLPSTIRIETNIDGIFDNVLANPTQIHQVLMNLCANGAQAMEEDGGVLSVSLSQVELGEEVVRQHPGRTAGTYLQLRVQDTGRGIPSEMIDKIYNPYFTTKAKGQGTGLGLSVVHGIIQSYAGIIEVASELGRGTTFDIFLPAICLEEVGEEMSVLQLPMGSEHILLVDDEAMLTEVLGNTLRLLGYQVTATQSSVRALKLFKEDPAAFDLLITDMTMPELTGDRLAAEVRAVRADLPMIICTGYNRRLSDHKPESLAVQAILMKPVEQQDLAKTVRRVLDYQFVSGNNNGDSL